ncbi:type VI secretion system-associated FHA domain protein [Photobacterium sp. J15]|uniref:type VI secretion system-associated FHA domain protein n=1 Tax=Photobacterium sp. J15 TaxID=265901 RepID=UPI0007E41F8D|nr:FHA domain-containing protein [Photobacterium sp. J15]
MPLSIRIISSPEGESISEWNKSFPEDGGDIGRAFGAAMQLSDARREVSGTHAIIRKTSRGYQVMDNSTNGLFINGSASPLGKGNQSTLNDGDVLDIGKYRLLVSCFIPEQAKAQDFSAAGQGNSVFGDDPFSNEAEAFPEPQVVQAEESAFTFAAATHEVVADDPFLAEEVEKRTERREFDLSFSAFDDDPLADAELQVNLPTHMSESQSKPELQSQSNMGAQMGLTEFRHHEQRMQEQMDKALEMALNRLLADISPEATESMFDYLTTPGFWSRKPKYWDMYKRHFNRQVESRDWHIKFHAYFHDALRLQRNMDGGS